MDILEKRLKKIISSWFVKEPLLFNIQATQRLTPNANLTIPMRSGQFRIEYSPKFLSAVDDEALEFYFKTEVFRILLGHPYQRLPLKPNYGVLSIASDVTVYQTCYMQKKGLSTTSSQKFDLPGVLYLKNQAVRFSILKHPLGTKWIDSEELHFFQRNLQIDHDTGCLSINDNLTFEKWYSKINFLVKETAIAGEDAGSSKDAELALPTDEYSGLWEENEDAKKEIKAQLQKAEIEEGWGGIGGNLQRNFMASADFSFDYRRALSQFRQNIVNASRTLTRMRPNRRYGFKAMGSRYEQKANILIAVDVSGSITDESFEHFSHAIKNFFFLGIIEKIDLIFFDVNLKNTTPITFRKKVNLESIKGRGGTSFQPAIDYFNQHKNEYSGMIIFTDGEGSIPVVSGSKNNILWILDSRLSYEKSYQWINSLPGNKATYLPF